MTKTKNKTMKGDIMNFFEQELRKLTVNFTLADAKFIGKVCYVPITSSTRLKLEFISIGTRNHYEAIRATMLDKREGKIDAITLTFADIWGGQMVRNFKITPYAWTNEGKTNWYGFNPTLSEYEKLSQQVESYAEIFSDQEQTLGLSMKQDRQNYIL